MNRYSSGSPKHNRPGEIVVSLVASGVILAISLATLTAWAYLGSVLLLGSGIIFLLIGIGATFHQWAQLRLHFNPVPPVSDLQAEPSPS
ncbi:MAG TPA: hypothetical protein VF272_00235 [Candidatus Saccharimonadia bacterium]